MVIMKIMTLFELEGQLANLGTEDIQVFNEEHSEEIY